MNLYQVLCRLYDENASIAGLIDGEKTMLLPIYHTTVAAQITVTIDEDGTFLDAEIIPDDEKEKRTLIPTTDESASRTSKAVPHPLCDNLKYLAGDYGDYVQDKDSTEKYQLYISNLKEWAESDYTHPKVQAVFRYLSKGKLIGDLIHAGVLTVCEDGLLDEKKKIQKLPQADAFVRFCIESNALLDRNMLEDTSGIFLPECWKDRSLQKCYIQFCRSKKEVQDLSYLTGEYTRISYLQPKKIRDEGDQSKMISSNDSTYFTFRGRFLNKEEAFAIGYEDSQKAHNALKWLVRMQGINYGSMCLVTWEDHLARIPDWQADTNTICKQAEDMVSEDKLQKEMADARLQEDDDDIENQYVGRVGQAEARRFQRAIWGCRKYVNPSSHMYILALDAATTGRLSMQEFRIISVSRYLDNLQNWHNHCAWKYTMEGKKGKYRLEGMVGVKNAAEILFGVEDKEGKHFSIKEKENDYKSFVKRWIPCVLDGREIPSDLVNRAERRASSPVSFQSRFLWEQVLSLACSLIRYQRWRRYKEDWTMALDEKCAIRDYLYGRLLAIADRVEYRTFDKDDGRQTNAKRYMNAFSQHPYRTWKMLEEKLTPYWGQLEAPERLVYLRLMDEVFNLFPIKDFEDDSQLNGLYLLGFHNQSYAMRKKKEETKNERDEGEN